MGTNVHISVIFPCNRNEPVARLAKQHLEKIESIYEDYEVSEVKWFLNELSKRTGANSGANGGLSLWGMIGNYTNVEEFCEALRAFWHDLLKLGCGLCEHEHIIVFYEHEECEHAWAYEIYLDKNTSKLIIKEHKNLPFAWMRM